MTVTLQDTKPFDKLVRLNDGFRGLDNQDFAHVRNVVGNLEKNLVNRRNLPGRTIEEKRHHIIMGELSELAVIKYLQFNDKHAAPVHNKLSANPDPGHDVEVRDNDGLAQCSVKSSNAYGKSWQEIISGFHFPFTREEIKRYNARAYFTLPVESVRLTQEEIDEHRLRKDISLHLWKRVETRERKPIKREGKDQFHAKIVTLFNVDNIEELYIFGRLIAVANNFLLENGTFEVYRDPNFQVNREMSKVLLSAGDTFEDFKGWLV